MEGEGVQIREEGEQMELEGEELSEIVVHNDTPVAPPANTIREPNLGLINGPRVEYLEFGVPLYEASVKCDWKAAKVILDQRPELVRYSITENGETALHVAASAKGRKSIVEFVESLVESMKIEDLALVNNNHSTALFLAAAAGNVETVEIMVKKNPDLRKIPGNEQMMPLYVAALFGNYDVVKYLYYNSNELQEDGWTDQNRSWLVQKCVENDMFDISLRIVNKHPILASNGNVLGVLARKPDAFIANKTDILWGIFIRVLVLFGLRNVAPEKENKALALLKVIWGNISKLSKKEIDDIIRGPADPINKKDTSASIRFQIQKHLDELEAESKRINNGQPSTSTSNNVVDTYLQLKALVSDHIAKLLLENQKVINQEDKQVRKGDQAMSKRVSQRIMSLHDEKQNIIKIHTRMDLNASIMNNVDVKVGMLNNLISEYIVDMHVAIEKKRTYYSSRVLFIAAEIGNTTFLVELIRVCPDLIWKVNDNNLSIFHIAAKHRHEGVYNLLYEIGAMKDLITPLKDEHNNNMLHLVGMRAKQTRLQDVSGVALQMQRELLWFQEVEAMIPPSYRERKNDDDLTPHELFTKEHKELVTQGEKWMKGTASQGIVVAALIATIVFAAAFTIPGGFRQNNGYPFFVTKGAFIVFVVTDAISLFSSSASILMFLSILTSRYAERDFLESLPNKLIIGLVTLFVSIATMTIAFSASSFVLYHKGWIWMPILIAVFAVLPGLLYVFLQYRLFFDVFRSTYRSKYLFKPQRHVLYYENPKV